MDAGFAIFPGVFSNAEMIQLGDALAAAPLERSRAGARHLMHLPAVLALAADSRLRAIVAPVLGANALPYRATLFDKSSAANWLVAWHQDTALPLCARVDVNGWGPWSEKSGVVYAHAPAAALARVLALRIHLDDSHADNGPLRVIPGSHDQGVLTDAEVSVRAAAAHVVICVVPSGGVVAMRPLAIHASSKAHSAAPRRVLHLEYAESLDVAPGLRLRVA